MQSEISSKYYQYEYDEQYCYPQSSVLKNKLNITQQNKLDEAERQITAVKLLALKMSPIPGNLDFQHICAIHHFIFSDVYDWAGVVRFVNISKGNLFCNFKFIDNAVSDLCVKLRKEHYLVGLPKNETAKKLSYYISELNAIHPFREGNGRTQRVFIEYLAQTAGYHADFSAVTAQDMIEASVDSFLLHYEKMEAIFEKITTPISKQEQTAFQKLLKIKLN
ncbi:MAG: Fic family protein [Spirochaetales bacterium]|nr:Fic family protein [Spirochaetales bacterium]